MNFLERSRTVVREWRANKKLEKQLDKSGHPKVGSIIKLYTAKGFWRVDKVERLETPGIPGNVLMQFEYYLTNVQDGSKRKEIVTFGIPV